MICSKCNEIIPENSKFCPNCGTKVQEEVLYSFMGNQNEEETSDILMDNQNKKEETSNLFTYTSDQVVDEEKILDSYEGKINIQKQTYGNEGNIKKPDPVLYLMLSILATLMCCFPLGLVGVYYSIKMNTYTNEGRYEEAFRAQKNVKVFLIASAVSLILCFAFVLFAMIVFSIV